MINLKFLPSHEWVRVEEDGTAYVGISGHAQEALGDIIYVELPEIGEIVTAGDEVGVVESVKAASDIYAPISGMVVAVNKELIGSPELINEDAQGLGWMYQVNLTGSYEEELLDLLSTEEYTAPNN